MDLKHHWDRGSSGGTPLPEKNMGFCGGEPAPGGSVEGGKALETLTHSLTLLPQTGLAYGLLRHSEGNSQG